MQITLPVLSLAALASGHGLVTKPATRGPGDATAAVCGKKMVDFYKADNTSYPEALLRANGGKYTDPNYAPAKCNLWLCKGYQFGDNAANVQSYTPGQVVDMEVFIRIPHTGYANVSVVDVVGNKIVAGPLKNWASGYAASVNPPKDQTKFSVTIPELAGKCTNAGECAIQWYWFGQGQTYESCIDFTVPKKTQPSPTATPSAFRA